MEKYNSKKEPIIFVTGNKDKLIEFKAIAGNFLNVTSMKLDVPELQGDPLEIAKDKALLTYQQIKKPVIIEDTSLCYNALKGLPGPYIKFFLKKLGLEGLNKLLAGYEDKSAYSQSIFAYMDEGMKEPELFVGQTQGKIVTARGPNRFGWDSIFEPEGYDQTYSEMPTEIKNKISHRYKALAALIEYFRKNEIIK